MVDKWKNLDVEVDPPYTREDLATSCVELERIDDFRYAYFTLISTPIFRLITNDRYHEETGAPRYTP